MAEPGWIDGMVPAAHCLLCAKPVNLTNEGRQLLDATAWTSRGNYGSKIYDVMPGDGNVRLEAYIHDDCLMQVAEAKNEPCIFEVKHVRRVVETSHHQWERET